jgi:hypothetical protein
MLVRNDRPPRLQKRNPQLIVPTQIVAAAQIELTRLIAEQAMIAGLLRLGGFEPGFPFALGADALRRQLGGERLAAFPRNRSGRMLSGS